MQRCENFTQFAGEFRRMIEVENERERERVCVREGTANSHSPIPQRRTLARFSPTPFLSSIGSSGSRELDQLGVFFFAEVVRRCRRRQF